MNVLVRLASVKMNTAAGLQVSLDTLTKTVATALSPIARHVLCFLFRSEYFPSSVGSGTSRTTFIFVGHLSRQNNTLGLYCHLLDEKKQIIRQYKMYNASLDDVSVKLIQISIKRYV